jgi:predicted nucleotidyltransferase
MANLTLDLSPRHIGELRRLIAAYLPNAEVWAYGSRVNGTGHDTSDLDLAVRNPQDLKTRQPAPAFWELKDALSESNLPFLIDLFDWATLPPAFHTEIERQHVILYAPDGYGQPSTPPRPERSAGAIGRRMGYGG